MKLANLQYFITQNGLRELCSKRSEKHCTNAVAIVATNGSLPLRAVPRKLVPLTPDPHDSSSQIIRKASLFARERKRDYFLTGHCWATPADPRPGGSSSSIEECTNPSEPDAQRAAEGLVIMMRVVMII